ncbi:MAG: Gfo/Idh/MocA family oxidoreductase [bacterium]|nr:Gfo/Idh/MocA family oxidoreductase [bacterium]
MNDKQQTNQVNRRSFIGHAAMGAAAFTALSASRVYGANERLAVGVIGAGGRGNSHMRAIHDLKDECKVDLIAVCDTYRPRLNAAAERYEIPKRYMNHKELLADAEVDVVSIATPDHVHGYQAIDAVLAGKDVYCEKPVTHWRQFELTKRLALEVQKTKRVFQLGTQGMSDGAWALMKKLVRDGLIGQPIHAECGYFRVGDWGERGMPIDDLNAQPGPDLDWDAFLGDSPQRPFDVSRYFRWRMYADYAGGPSTDLFPHVFTPVLSILGVSMPSTVVATGGKFRYQEREIPDTFNMLIDYPENITVAILGTQGNDYQGCGGTRGSAGRIPIVRGWDGTVTVIGNDVVFYPAQESNKEGQTFPIPAGEDWYGYWKNFFQCVRDANPETLSPAYLAYWVQTVFHMAMLGHREGKVAKFDSARDAIVL